MGVEIVGVSFADPETNALWAEEQGYQYEIWTDSDKTLSLYYGAIDNEFAFVPKRVTKVLDADGELVLEYVGAVSVDTHPGEVLEDCLLLFGP